MTPRVRPNLMAARVGSFDRCRAVVDAAVESAREEESGLGSCGVQGFDQFLGVLTRSVIKGKSEDTRLAAFAVDDTRCRPALSFLEEGGWDRCCGGQTADGENSGKKRREMHLSNLNCPDRIAVTYLVI